jgi:1-acyl-sn-glycerol-3-phosphate acyltransferase
MFRTLFASVRTVVVFAVVGPATVILGTYVIVAAHFRPQSRTITWCMRTWGNLWIWCGGLRPTVEGTEHIQPDGSYMIVSNHLSGFDVALHIARLPVSVRFLAKKELFRIPLFGSAMRAIGIVETDRQAGTAAHRAINAQVARVMDLRRSLLIYPEGTRSRDGELHAFKKGAFRIAIDMSLPVVPVAVWGTREAWAPGSKLIRGGPATVVVHEPIPTAELGPTDIGALRDRAHAAIAATLERLQAEEA